MTPAPSELIDATLVNNEESKRRRNWDPKSRWQSLQATIAWAESQSTVRRNTKEACLANQRRLLAQFAARGEQ
jgi:hypothetical protein